MKRATYTRFAFQPQLPAHQIYKASCNRQSKSGPPILSRRGTVGLGKCSEDHPLFLFCDSNSCVAHAEMKNHDLPSRRQVPLDFDDYLSSFREFHGISYQIYEHLPHATAVTCQIVRYVLCHAPRKFQSLLVRAKSESLQGFADALPQRKIGHVQVQFSRFDFGEIEDVVNQR